MQNLVATEESEENHHILSLMPIPIAILKGKEHVIKFANTAMLEFWRRQANMTIGFPLHDVLPELDSSYHQQLNQVLSSGTTFKLEEVLLNLNDQQGNPYSIYIDYTYQPIRDQAGQITGVLVTAIDVSHKVNANKSLQESTTKLEQANQALHFKNQECLMAIETAKLGTWKLTPSKDELECSDRTVQILGLTDKCLSFQTLLDRITGEHRETVKNEFNQSMQKGNSLEIEFPVLHIESASERWVRLSGRVSGEECQSGTLMDITDQKMDIIRKNQFIAMVSHELKTPLTSLLGMLQMINRKITAEKDEHLRQIIGKSLHQVNKMTRMINSFVTISRLESGKFSLERTEFDMEELVSECLSEAQVSATSHQLIQQKCNTVRILADRIKIGAVLANLISNAIKYSPQHSTITISCQQKDDAVEVAVHDQGSGITESDRKRVFERFSHIDNSRVMHAAGFGIGLYLSSEIIRHHQGEIWVNNNPDTGCTFHFRLPSIT